MKLNISRNVLSNGLSKVARAISIKTPIPILSGIKFEVNNDGLILTASDSDVTIQTIIKNDNNILEVINPGIVVLSSKYITEIIRKMEDDFVTIEIIDGLLVKIHSAKSEFKLNSFNPFDYPHIDLNKKGELFSIDSMQFSQLVNQTAFAVSTSETRPVLTAVNFKAKENVLECVATDSYRLAKKIIQLEKPIYFNINVSARALEDISKIIEKELDINIYVSDKKILFDLDNSIIQTRLIDGAYPDTSNLIPKSFLRELTIDLRKLDSAVDRVSLLSSTEMSNVIKIKIDKESVLLFSRSQEVGSVDEHLTAIEYTGDPLEISFSAKYLSDAIKSFDCNEIKICFLGDMEPFIIKDINDDTVTQLILPVRTY